MVSQRTSKLGFDFKEQVLKGSETRGGMKAQVKGEMSERKQ